MCPPRQVQEEKEHGADSLILTKVIRQIHMGNDGTLQCNSTFAISQHKSLMLASNCCQCSIKWVCDTFPRRSSKESHWTQTWSQKPQGKVSLTLSAQELKEDAGRHFGVGEGVWDRGKAKDGWAHGRAGRPGDRGGARIWNLCWILTPVPNLSSQDTAAQRCAINFDSAVQSSTIQAALHYPGKGGNIPPQPVPAPVPAFQGKARQPPIPA